MPTVTKIDEYTVMYSSNNFVPRIWLSSGGSSLGQLLFYPNGATLPDASISGGKVNMYYHLDNYHNLLDLLRNEAPVYLFWVGPGSLNENAIKTNPELAGEGES